jgi:hypothetical protein
MVVGNPKRIRCVVIAVPTESELRASRGALAHDLVPGADPYVAQLIKRLQDEVRGERRAQAAVRCRKLTTVNRLRGTRSIAADMEIPWFDMPEDEDPLAEDGDSMPEFRRDASDDVAPAW